MTVSTGWDAATGRYPRRTKRVYGKRADAVRVRSTMILEGRGPLEQVKRAVTVGDLLDRWLVHLERIGRRPLTIYGHRNVAERSLRPVIGTTKLSELTALDLDELYAGLRAKGQAPATIRQAHAIIRAALHQAQRWGLVRDNVAAFATAPPLDRQEIDPPAADEVVAVLAAAHTLDPVLGLAVQLAAATGARRGEVCALRWTDVDLDTRTLTIRRNISTVKGASIIEGPTKTRASRRIALDPDTVKALRARRQAVGPAVAAGGFVISTDPLGAAPWRPDRLSHLWADACRLAGVKDVRLHDLRHAHATELLGAGIDVATVGRRLGHSQLSTTHNFYLHGRDAADQAAAAVTGRVLRTKARKPAG